MPYQCNLAGRCVEGNSWDRGYDTLEECQANCKGLATQEDVEMAYIISGYDWELVDQMSNADKQEVVKREFGVSLGVIPAGNLVYYLARDDYEKILLFPYPRIQEYVDRQLDDIDRLLLEIRYLCPGRLSSYKRFREDFEEVVKLVMRDYHNGGYDHETIISILATGIASGRYRSFFHTCETREQYLKVEDLIRGYFPFLERIYS